MTIGDGLDPLTDMGPLTTLARQKTFGTIIDTARQLGGKSWETARAIPQKGWFMRPILITDLSWDSPLFQWELFGPAAIVVPYDALDQVFSHLNARNTGLVAYLFGSGDRLQTQAAVLDYGTIGINTVHITHSAIPFTGWKSSGQGVSLGPDTLAFYQQTQHIHWGQVG